MKPSILYRALVSIVLVFILWNIYQFRVMSDTFYSEIERPFMQAAAERSGNIAPVINRITDTLDGQKSSGMYFGVFAVFAALLAVIPWFLPGKILARMDFYLLAVLFLLLPVVYSKDTKENFLLVKETHFRIFIIGMFALYFYRNLLSGRLVQRFKEVPASATILCGLAIASLAWTINASITLHFTAVLISYFFFYLLLADGTREKWQLVSLCNIAVAMAALDSSYGILQYYGFDPLFGAGEVVGNEDRKRVFSFFGNPVFIGVYLDAVLPVALSLFLFAIPQKGDYEHIAEAVAMRISQGLICFSAFFPPLYIMMTRKALFNALGTYDFGPVLQKNSAQVSQIMWQTSQSTFFLAIVFCTILVGGIIFLRNLMPGIKEFERSFSQAFIGGSGFLFILACLFITFTRTAWIAMAGSLLTVLILMAVYCNHLVYKYRRYVLAFLIAAVVISCFLTWNFFGKNMGTESISNRLTSAFTVLQRMMLFDISVKMWRDYPLLGAGWGNFGNLYPLYQAKFYSDGPFYLIPWTNSFCNTSPMRFLLNFLVYSFYMLQSSMTYLILVCLYLISALVTLVLYVIYFGKIRDKRIHQLTMVLLLLPAIVFAGFFHLDSSVNGNRFLAITMSDGSGMVRHVHMDAIKTGEVLLTGSDATVTSISDRYLSRNEPVLPPDAESYHWLAAGFAHAHNEYLQIMTDIGIPGIIAFLALFFFFFQKALKLLHDLGDPAERLLVIGFIGTVMAGLIESLANFPFQRLTPVVFNTLAFMAIYYGPRIFASHKDHAPESVSVFPEDVPEEKSMGAFLGAILILPIIVLPMQYTSSNVMLKSGHVRIMEAQKYYTDPGGQEIAPLFLQTASQYLRESVRLAPHVTEASFWLADLERMFGHYNEAIEMFEASLYYGHNKNIYHSMGNTFFELHRNESDPVKKEEFLKKALVNWEMTTRMNPNFASASKRLAHYYYSIRSYDSAEIWLRKLVRWDKADMDGWRMLAKVQLDQQKEPEALDTLTEMLKWHKKRGGAPDTFYAQLAQMKVARKDIDGAMVLLEEYCPVHPEDTSSMMSLYNIYIEKGLWVEARTILKQIYTKKPDAKKYHVQLAGIYQREGKQDKAYFELATAWNMDTSDTKIFQMMKAMEGSVNQK